MPDAAIVLACYALSWVPRIRFAARSFRAPSRRGPGWFFDLRVDEGFWNARGREIFHAYALRVALPLAIDIPILWTIVGSRQYVLAVLLIAAVGVIQKLNHFSNVRVAARRAEATGLARRDDPPKQLVLSLRPRRLRDYMLLHVEATIAACNVLALLWIALIDWRTGTPHGLWALWGVPIFLLYIQAGALLAKSIAIECRSLAGGQAAQSQAQASEALRRHRALVCDVVRAGAGVSLLFWPVKVAIASAQAPYAVAIFFAGSVVVAMALAARIEVGRRQLDSTICSMPPMTAPETGTPAWPVCFAPSSPLPVLPSHRGYSINFAHRQSQTAAIYLTGLAILAARLALG